MKIQRLQGNAGGTGKVDDRKTNGVTKSREAAPSDPMSAPKDSIQVGPGKPQFDVNGGYPPRMDRVEAAVERVKNDSYVSEFQNDVAEKVADSNAVGDIVAEAAMNAKERAAIREEKVESTRRMIESGRYDEPEVLRQTAENLIDALGLTSLLK